MSRYRGLVQGIGAHAALWTTLALLFATQRYTAGEPQPPRVWFEIAGPELLRWHAWTVVAPLVLVLVRVLPIRGDRWLPRLALYGALALPAVALRTTVALGLGAVFIGPSPEPDFVRSLTRALHARFAFDVLIYVLVVAAAHALLFAREAHRTAVAAGRLEAQLSRARLGALEAQLHPHFLFNTLHTVSALLDRDLPLARRVLARFAELLRMVLDAESPAFMPLAWELAFLQRYADIQRVRFGDRFRFRIESAPLAETVLVPRLLLQPIVENAIRHGVEVVERPVIVTVTCRLEPTMLVILVADTGPGFAEPAQERTGLHNVRERLREAFGPGARLAIDGVSGGGTIVRLEAPLTRARFAHGRP